MHDTLGTPMTDAVKLNFRPDAPTQWSGLNFEPYNWQIGSVNFDSKSMLATFAPHTTVKKEITQRMLCTPRN
jgi:hypothetical protein